MAFAWLRASRLLFFSFLQDRMFIITIFFYILISKSVPHKELMEGVWGGEIWIGRRAVQKLVSMNRYFAGLFNVAF